MSRIVIRESEIRQYVRHLLRESIEAEGAAPSQGKIDRWLQMSPEEIEAWEPTSSRDDALDIKNRKLMLLGQDYDRKPFGNLSKGIEKAYRQMKGYPPIIGVSGRGAAAAREEIEKCRQQGIEPIIEKNGYTVSRISGENGADISTENTEDAIAQRQEMRRQDHTQKMANRNVRVGDREDRARNREIVLGNSDNSENDSIDKFANNAEGDATTQEWLSMTPEEKAAKAKAIRDDLKSRQSEKNKELQNLASILGRRPVVTPTKEELEQGIRDLKAKRDALEDNDLNQDAIDRYNYLIRDKERILRQYHGGLSDDTDANSIYDDMVGDAMSDINNFSDEQVAGLKDELSNDGSGQEYIDPSKFELSNQQAQNLQLNKEKDDEIIDDEYDTDPLYHTSFDGKQRKQRNFDDAKEMGLFGDDDYEWD